MHHYLTDKQPCLTPCLYMCSQAASISSPMLHMQGQRDLGFLMNPGEGALSAVALFVPPGAAAPTHLFSGGVDGTLAVWSAGRSWDCLKVCVTIIALLFNMNKAHGASI